MVKDAYIQKVAEKEGGEEDLEEMFDDDSD